MANLRTDYVDDELDVSVNENRRYRMIDNGDGTVSFEDVTEYLQQGDNYGSAEVNEQNETINQITVDLSDKINISDIINDLTSTATNKPLSANQGKVLDGKISNLPVKANDTHFYNNNGLNVTNTTASDYTDVNCRNVLAAGGYVKTNVSALNITNGSGNAWLPINASDVKINGAKSVYDSLPKTYSFSNISLTADGIGYLDYNVLRPSTHIVTSVFGTVASPGGLCRFELLADMTNDVYAIQPWTYKDVKVTSTTANVTIGYVKR